MAVPWSESIHQHRMFLRGVPGGGRVSARGGRQQFPLAAPNPNSNQYSYLPQQQRRLQAEPLPRRNLPEVGLSWHCAM